PSQPTGQALCAKGRTAPELVYHPERLLHPLKRTRPKGDADPGWQQISWDEALDLTATRLRKLADEHGPESVVFSMVSPSTSAIADSAAWIQRLGRAFGSPNHCGSLELCGWGRGYATRYTYGMGMGTAGTPMPDLEKAGCILFWGYNPSVARLSHATAASRRSSANTRSARAKPGSPVARPSISPPRSVGATPPTRSRRSVASRPTTSSTRPGCSGNRGPSPTTRGAASSSRATPPRW